MLSSNSTLGSSSPDFSRRIHHQHYPFTPHYRYRSHSRTHHHHHHQPSWSSSISSYSPNRTSNFLIDEYGNEHDPEHCQFKTVAHSEPRHSSESGSSCASASSRSSSRSSYTHRTPVSPPPLHGFAHPVSYAPQMVTGESSKRRKRRKCPGTSEEEFKWARALWAHFRPHHHQQSLGSATGRQMSSSEDGRSLGATSQGHMLGVRRKIEVVKLEVRFGILRTRKRVLGVWKKL